MEVLFLFQGTFNPTTGIFAINSCTDCTQGHYCGTTGLNAPTDNCTEGYYCPTGQSVSDPIATPCTVYHYCPWGSSEPLPCQNGTYMNHTHGAICDICPDGW